MGRRSGSHDAQDGAELAREQEAELIQRCLAGERAAQELLYVNHRRQVAANLYRVMGDRIELDDLVQEVFVIAFRGLGKFRRESRLSTWLYRIAVNVALGRIRSRSRRPPPVSLPDNLTDRVDPSLERPQETPRRTLERKQDQARVYSALAKLPPKKRIVLFLHEIQGLELKEIADLIGTHPVTVRTRLFYARREFYRIVAEGAE